MYKEIDAFFYFIFSHEKSKKSKSKKTLFQVGKIKHLLYFKSVK